MFIYLLKSEDTGRYKIGKSKNPEKRLKELQTGNAEKILLLNYVEVSSDFANKIEVSMHDKYNYLRLIGEWFQLSLEDEYQFEKSVKLIESNLKYLKENGNDFI